MSALRFYRHIPVLFLGLTLVSCADTGRSSYESISSKTVSGMTLEMVRRSQLDSQGNPTGVADYGILAPNRRFYGCGEEPCSDADFERVAAMADSDSLGEDGPGGGGGGGGGGM